MKDIKIYQLAKYVRAGFQDEILYFGFGSIQQKIQDKELQKLILRVANQWLLPQTKEQIIKTCETKNITTEAVQQSIQFLEKNKFLIEVGIYDHESRYSRSHLYYQMSGANAKVTQSVLEKKKIAILGCGGIGNIVGVHLATMGVEELVLIDHDTIEMSNLTRQILFDESDIGLKKCKILKKKLQARNHYVKISAFDQSITKYSDTSILKDVDFIVLSADAEDVMEIITEFCMRTKTPYLNVGYVEDIAVFGPLVIPGKTGCLMCQDVVASQTQPEIKNINNHYQAPSFGPINMISASMATLDIVKFFGVFGEIQSLNKRVGFWSHDFHFEYQNCEKNPTCAYCNMVTQPAKNFEALYV